jgi:hypothetical protein
MVDKDYVPEFSWRVQGGTANYEQWIYDHEDPIARFDSTLVEQPEQSLRYFNLIPRPLVLRRLKLVPGGAPLVEGVQLYWVLRRSAMVAGARTVTTDRPADLRVEGEGSDRLVTRFSSRDLGGMATSMRILTLTYDWKLRSYIYDFQCILNVLSPEDFYGSPEVSFEYSDPWFCDLPAPAVAFPGTWRGRYQRFVYEDPNGEILQIPLNHFSSSHKSNIRLKQDGLFAAVYEPTGNPAFQFAGETAKKTVLSICPWGYDVHFELHLKPEELSKPMEARFRVFQLPGEAAKRMEETTKLPPLKPEELPFSVVPAYERRCSFNKPCDANKSYEGLDPWPWTPLSGNGHYWDETEGCSDSFSLRISKEDYGLAQWGIKHEGAGGWMEPWTPRKAAVHISCFVKTRDVEGAGSSISARYNIPNEPDIYPIISSLKLKGTNDWIRLSLHLDPAPEEAYFIHIFLRQEGRGTTWFDDFEVEYAK